MSTTTTTTTTGGGIAARLARKNILELSPYRCARDDYSTGILLDANENAYGPPIVYNEKEVVVLERYPDPYQIPLKEKVCQYRSGYGLTPAHIFVGVGSDEAIDLLFRIFCIPGHDQIIITPPTYGMYKVCAKVNDVDMINVPLTPDFDLQIEKIVEAITPQVKLIFLCSPGNPTCKALPLSDMEQVVQKAPNSIVVIDEAYVDFSSKGSGLSLITKYPNVVVLQTLSKAFGLAAIRCGFCMGSPDVIQLMNNVKAPYNVNALTSKVAMEALDHTDTLQEHVQALLDQRTYVEEQLNQLEYVTKVYPSDSNFLLFRLHSSSGGDDDGNTTSTAQAVYKKMADDGVVTRYRGTELHCDECIRVTIGTPDENKAFLQLLDQTYQALNSHYKSS